MAKTNTTYNQKTMLENILPALKPFIQLDWTELAEILTKDYPDGIWHFCDLDRDQQLFIILSCPSMYDALKDYWKSITHNGIIEINEFESESVDYHLDFDYQILVQCSLNLSVIHKIDEYYIVSRKNVLEALTHINVSHNKSSRQDIPEILNAFFSCWYTLEETGAMYGLTRERVRQYAKKFAVTSEPLFEDYFAEPFQTFKLSREDFVNMFPEISVTGFKYLSLRYGHGKIPFTVENVDEYMGLWHNRVAQYLQEQLKAKLSSPSAQDLVLEIMKNNMNHPMTTKEIYQKYVRMTKGKPVTEISIYNFLNKRKDIIINQYNQYRMYTVDPQLLWDTIDFNRYKNSVTATDLIYNDYPELMMELQLADSRELYYVIKNTVSDFWKGDFKIQCRRCPVIVFGEMTDAEQALRLLKEMSPVSHNDYYTEYEKRYGSPQEIAQGNPNIRHTLTPYNKDRYYIYDPNICGEHTAENNKNQKGI